MSRLAGSSDGFDFTPIQSGVVLAHNHDITYGGYRWGHKAERYTGRQIGFAQMPRDRDVGYEAGEAEGRLLTVARRLEHPPHLTVNAKVNPAEGELRVRIVDKGGQIPGSGRGPPGTDSISCNTRPTLNTGSH